MELSQPWNHFENNGQVTFDLLYENRTRSLRFCEICQIVVLKATKGLCVKLRKQQNHLSLFKSFAGDIIVNFLNKIKWRI